MVESITFIFSAVERKPPIELLFVIFKRHFVNSKMFRMYLMSLFFGM